MPETWKTGTWTFAYLNKLRQILYKVYSKEFLMQISSLYNVLYCNLALKGLLRRRGLKIAQDKTLMKEIGSLMQLVEIFSQVDLPSNS